MRAKEIITLYCIFDTKTKNPYSTKVFGVGFGERPFSKKVLPIVSPSFPERLVFCHNGSGPAVAIGGVFFAVDVVCGIDEDFLDFLVIVGGD